MNSKACQEIEGSDVRKITRSSITIKEIPEKDVLKASNKVSSLIRLASKGRSRNKYSKI